MPKTLFQEEVNIEDIVPRSNLINRAWIEYLNRKSKERQTVTPFDTLFPVTLAGFCNAR